MKNISYILLMSVFVISCQDVIDLEIENSASYIVVDGEINDLGGTKTIDLYYSNAYFDSNIPEPVTGVEVVLFENQIPVDTLNEVQPGKYETPFVGTIGNAYYIAFTVGSNTYESVPERMNRINPIDSIYARFENTNPFLEPGYYVYFDTREPAGRGDYYRWRTYYNGEYQNDPFDITVFDDRLVDGNPIDEFQVNFEPWNVGDTVRIEQMSITRTNYDYWTLISTQTAQVGSTFDAPPAPVIGNIICTTNPDELVLGYFSASAIREAEIIIEP